MSIIPINAPEGLPLPNISFVYSDDAHVPLMMLQLLIFTMLMTLILNTHAKTSKTGNTILVPSQERTSSPVPLDPNNFQSVIPDLPTNSRVNSAFVFIMRLAILC